VPVKIKGEQTLNVMEYNSSLPERGAVPLDPEGIEPLAAEDVAGVPAGNAAASHRVPDLRHTICKQH
jgi:hypothetical protein